MSVWRETTLGNEANLITGFPFKSSQYTDDTNGIRLLRGDNIVQGKLRWEGVKQWPSNDSTINPMYQLSEGDVVLAMDRPWIEAGLKFSVISRFDLPCLLVQRVACIRGWKKLDSTFLRYLIASKEFTKHILAVETGTAVPHISASQIKEFSFKSPPIPEQKAIAAVLSSLDDKIDLLHRQNLTLEAMAETLFRQWFVEEAQEDWIEGKIEDLFILQRGYDLPIQNRIEGDYPVFAASGFSGGHVEYKVKAPGVTTGRSGLLGKVYFVQDDFWPLNTSLYVKEFKRGTPLFSYFVLKNIDLEIFNAGSAVPTLNRNHVHEYSISIPPDELINEFELRMIPNFKKIKSNQVQVKNLEKLRDTLLPKLMSGEVRVAL